MRTNKLMIRKPEGGFRGAVVPAVLGLALAVSAAAGGCDNSAWTGSAGEAVYAETGAGGEAATAGTDALAFNSAATGSDSAAGKSVLVAVKFEVKNGGWGLLKSEGIVSSKDDSYLVYNHAAAANDFEIVIRKNVGENLVVRWKATDIWWKDTYLKAGISVYNNRRTYVIGLDYNGQGEIAASGLDNVSVSGKNAGDDFDKALKRAKGTQPEFPGFRKISVKFEVQNGGPGLGKSEGVASSADDSTSVVYDGNICANDFTITLDVPEEDEFINIGWKGTQGVADTFCYGKIKLDNNKQYIADIDYNGLNNVATKNLYDVIVELYVDSRYGSPIVARGGGRYDNMRWKAVHNK